jgi:hypothetical protein
MPTGIGFILNELAMASYPGVTPRSSGKKEKAIVASLRFPFGTIPKESAE